ncbi:MAG: hypothetical protein AAF413_04145 [Patescibacteria group bacterium]
MKIDWGQLRDYHSVPESRETVQELASRIASVLLELSINPMSVAGGFDDIWRAIQYRAPNCLSGSAILAAGVPSVASGVSTALVRMNGDPNSAHYQINIGECGEEGLVYAVERGDISDEPFRITGSMIGYDLFQRLIASGNQCAWTLFQKRCSEQSKTPKTIDVLDQGISDTEPVGLVEQTSTKDQRYLSLLQTPS